jgi:hypothetical protein
MLLKSVRFALLFALLAIPALAQEQAPFLLVLPDPANSHFAVESLSKDLPAAIQKRLGPQARKGPEVDSQGAARDYAARDNARFYVYAQCGIVIELLKVCDAHIKHCAHSCEAWLFQGDKQLSHAKVTGEKGGTDAVKKLIAQLPALLEPLNAPLLAIASQEKAERDARVAVEKAQKQLAIAEKERKAAEEKERRAIAIEEARKQKEALAEEKRRAALAEKALREAKTAEQKKIAGQRVAEERRRAEEARQERLARIEELKKAQAAKSQQAKLAAEEARLRAESDAAAKKLAAEREKRLALERAQASRVIHLVPGQTVAVLEVENDLQGGARNQVNFQLLTDNLRKRVSKSGLGLLVMDRDAIFQILSANEKKVLECQANCETHLGRILRSDYVISGRLGKQGQSFRLYLLMYRSGDGALLSDAVATSDELAALDKKAAAASTDLLSVFPLPR